MSLPKIRNSIVVSVISALSMEAILKARALRTQLLKGTG